MIEEIDKLKQRLTRVEAVLSNVLDALENPENPIPISRFEMENRLWDSFCTKCNRTDPLSKGDGTCEYGQQCPCGKG